MYSEWEPVFICLRVDSLLFKNDTKVRQDTEIAQNI
jgi:hypothetical protein